MRILTIAGAKPLAEHVGVRSAYASAPEALVDEPTQEQLRQLMATLVGSLELVAA